MKILLVSGAPSTGKSTTVYYLCDFLLSKGYVKTDIPYNGYSFVAPISFPPVCLNDFACLLEKNGLKVLIHTATDDSVNIDWLFNHIGKYEPNIVITTCRDIYDPRTYFCSKLKITAGHLIECSTADIEEFPLAKITRRNDYDLAYEWYFTNTTHLLKKIITSIPYSL